MVTVVPHTACGTNPLVAEQDGGKSMVLNDCDDAEAHLCDEAGVRQYVKSRQEHNKRWPRYRGPETLRWLTIRNDHITCDGKAFTCDGARDLPVHLREGVFYPACDIPAARSSKASADSHLSSRRQVQFL